MTTIMTHIGLDERGVAWIEGANTKVTEILLDWLAHGSSPAEIHFQYPHLSLAQIHAAFCYYYDHKAELDIEIERVYQWTEQLRIDNPNAESRDELLRKLKRA